MDVNMRTTFYKHTQGLLRSVILSWVIVLCASTPIPTPEQIHPRVHYARLVQHTEVLYQQHHTVYTDFKQVRYNEPSIRVDDFTIAGIPSVHELPAPYLRLEMNESQLLPNYYTRLQAFQQIFALAIADEFRVRLTGENDFYYRMGEVQTLLQRVVSKLRQTMVRLDIEHDFETAPTISFSTNDSASHLNMRILFVMQELSENLVPVLQDFDRFKTAHDESS